MNHKDYKERLQLLLYDELSEKEKRELEQHLAGCADCRADLEELRKLHSAFAQHHRVTLSHQMLTDARREFRVAMHEKLSRPTLWERLIEPIYKISFSGIATLGVGFVLGYVMSSAPQLRGVLGEQAGESTPILEGDTQITNVRFLDPDASDGEIEFTFDAVRPVRMKGNINDPQVQKLLAHALVSSQNPGVRLKSVSALAEHPDPLTGKDIREALLGALTSDANPGVRKEALTLLQKLPFDNEIKDALLFVLKNDQNSGVRIAAITGLEKFKGQAALKDEEVLKVLREKVEKDDNNYIRLIARNFLEEIKQQ